MPDLTETIETLTTTMVGDASIPLKSEVDGQSAEGHKLTEQIALHKYLSSIEAAKKLARRGGFKRSKIIPPGATGDS